MATLMSKCTVAMQVPCKGGKKLCSNEGTEGTCYELEERAERRSGQKEERKAVCLL